MSSIDERIVELRFNNKEFEKGIRQSQAALAELQKSLKLSEGTKGLENIQKAVSGLSLTNVSDALENISSKFSVVGAVGFTVLQNLTNAAINLGTNLISKVLDPIFEGGSKRALNIEKARFQFQGLGMDVEKTMAAALEAVKGTAYGLDEAAVAAASFGASGVPLDKMAESLRAISGVAAMTGSSYGDISNVFTAVAGNGRLMANELNRLSARGVNAAATLAKQMGKTEAEIREMTSKGKISFEMFASAMSNAFGEHAKKANETYTGSLSNMRAALARIGAAFMAVKFENHRDIFNSLTPAIDLLAGALTPLVKTYEDITKASSQALIGFIDTAVESGNLKRAVDPIIASVKNVVMALREFWNISREAFTDIFPGDFWEGLQRFTRWIATVAGALRKGIFQESENIKRSLKGLFAIFDIFGMVISSIVQIIGRLVGSFSGVNSSILEFTGDIGDWVVGVRDAMREGTLFNTIVTKIGDALLWPIEKIREFGKWIRETFSFDLTIESWEAAVTGLGKAVKAVKDFMQPAVDWIKNALTEVWQGAQEAFKNMDFNLLVGLLNVGAVSGLGVILTKIFKNGFDLNFNFGQAGLIDQIKGIFGSITDTLSAMQTKVEADTIIKIATALAILTASVIALSFIDIASLGVSLGAITVMLGQLMGAMALFEKTVQGMGVIKMVALSASLMTLSIALVVFASAIKILSTIPWDKALVGVGSMAAILGIVAGYGALIKKAQADLPGLIGIATALVIFASAMKIFSSMSWEELLAGVSTIGAMLLVIVGAGALARKAQASLPSLLGVAVALTILGGAMQIFSSLSWDQIARGATAMAASMAMLVGALLLLDLLKFAPVGAASMVLMAGAMVILSQAMKSFGNMSWEAIGKSITMLASSLAILAGALYLMTAGLPGAAALLIAAAALTVLVPALALLGSLSWDVIGTALGGLAAALGIIAAGGILLAAALPGLLGLGIAAILIGKGAEAAGAGLLAMATGIALLVGLGAGAAIAFDKIVKVLAKSIPGLFKAFAQGVLEFARTMAESTEEFVRIGADLFLALLDIVKEVAPEFIDTVGDLLLDLVDRIEEDVPKFVDSGMKLIIGILKGIGDNLQEVVEEGANIAINFMNGVASKLPEILDAGANLVISFVQGLADTIDSRSQEMADAGWDLAESIIKGMTRGITEGVDRVVNAARNVAESAVNTVKSWLGINSPSKEFIKIGEFTSDGLAVGILDGLGTVGKAANTLGNTAINSTKKALRISSPSKVFEELGRFTGEGFARGLLGALAPIESVATQAFKDMEDRLRSTMESLKSDIDKYNADISRATSGRIDTQNQIQQNAHDLEYAQKQKASISSLEKKVKDLTTQSDNLAKSKRDADKAEKKLVDERLSAAKKDLDNAKKSADSISDLETRATVLNMTQDEYNGSLRETQALLLKANSEYYRTADAHRFLTEGLKEEKAMLEDLATEHEALTQRVDEARNSLDSAIQTREDYRKSIREQFAALTDISSETKLGDYVDDLNTKIEKTLEFSNKLQTLRSIGLSDELYKELLSSGYQSLPFIDELIASGVEGVTELNTLAERLDWAATDLGNSASSSLYDAGVDIARGLLMGLEAEEAALRKQMENLADMMVNAIKQRLGISSPSKEFIKLGRFIDDGLVKGLSDGAKKVKNMTDDIGDDVIETMRKTIDDIYDTILSDMDMNPVITPILDLSEVQRNAGLIGDMINPGDNLDIRRNYQTASQTSRDRAAVDSADSGRPPVAETNVNYNQTITSPKAVSQAETYRQTKNLLSIKKRELTT